MSEKLPEMVIFVHDGATYEVPVDVMLEPDSEEARTWFDSLAMGSLVVPNEVVQRVLELTTR